MLELYLIRHPKTYANKLKILQGQNDTPLMPNWEKSVDELAKKLAERKPFDAFFSSDLIRADIPARRIVDYLRKRQEGFPLNYHSTPNLRERHWGTFENTSVDSIDSGKVHVLDYLFYENGIPQMETHAEVQGRIEVFSEQELKEFIESKDKLSKVVIMGHANLISYFINWLKTVNIIDGPYKRLNHLEMIALSVEATPKGRVVKDIQLA